MAKKILVIEDDPAAIRLISYTMEQEGFEVVTAKNGIDGFKEAVRNTPDLIILDVMMPKVDGFQICRGLRRESSTCYIPILMFSARAQKTDQAIGLEAGADDYITKPADPTELVSRVKRLLAKSGAKISK